MITILWDSNALSWVQDYLPAGRYRACKPIRIDDHVAGIQSFIRRGVVKLDDQVSAASIDDIFHFNAVKMHRRDLAALDDHDLFRVRLAAMCDQILRAAIANSKHT